MSDELHERVEADPMLSAAEKETTLSMCGDDEWARIHSDKPTVVRSLLQHDHFEVTHIRGGESDGTTRRADTRAAAREHCPVIHSVTGEMPVGCLTVKSSPRTNNYQSSIVSHEGIDAEVFDDGE